MSVRNTALYFIFFGLLFYSASNRAWAESSACSGAEIDFDAALSKSEVEDFEKLFSDALDKVCNWWGKSFTGTFVIEIDDSRGPSMALVPAWRGDRGRILFRAPTIRRESNATVHEIVHVFAPNANRFLAEGLAVYAHEHLDGVGAYPNFGEDIHKAAKEFAEDAEIAALERLATPQRLQNNQFGGKDAYKVAGSFVRFLIERHGLERFRRLFALTPLVPGSRDAGNPSRWQQVYGVDLDSLAADWRAVITQ